MRTRAGERLARTGLATVVLAMCGGCAVHVAFHGCRQNADAVGDAFARHAGYNRWADSNGLIVLYPQTSASYFRIFNPRGCWDWWGYTGPDYAMQSAPQIRAVIAMIERLRK